MAAILDFTQNVRTNIRFGHTPMSDMLENSMEHTKIMIVLLFCQKWYQFIVSPCANGGHLGFYSQCNVQSTISLHHYVRHNWSRMLDTKIKNLRLFCRKNIIFLFHLVQMAAILDFLSPQKNVGAFILPITLFLKFDAKLHDYSCDCIDKIMNELMDWLIGLIERTNEQTSKRVNK